MASEAGLTAQDAMAAIARATAFELPLKRRVEGVTWMVWGFVTAGATLSTNAMELVYGFPGPRWGWVVPWLWLLAGVAGTTAVWRIAALARPDAHPGRRAAAIAVATIVGLIAAVWVPVSILVPGQNQAAFVLVTVAVPWLGLAAANPHRVSRLGRRVMAGIGGVLVVTALLWLPSTGSLPHGAFPQTMMLAALVGGGAPLALGFWQALRG